MTVRGSNGHNNGDGTNDSGNEGSNIIRMPDKKERAQAERIRTRITLGGKDKTPGLPKPPPLLNLPPVTKFLLIVLIAVEIVMKLALNEVQQYWMMEHFGFVPAYYTESRYFGWQVFAGPFTYAFLHGGWLHLGMNGLMLLAFGSGLERWMGWKRMVLLMLGCSLIAAFIHLLFNIGSTNPVIGASGALSGMFAAAFVMIQKSQQNTPNQFKLLPMVAVWIAITVVFGMMGGPGGANIAWIAHIGGFLAGLVLVKPILRLKI